MSTSQSRIGWIELISEFWKDWTSETNRKKWHKWTSKLVSKQANKQTVGANKWISGGKMNGKINKFVFDSQRLIERQKRLIKIIYEFMNESRINYLKGDRKKVLIICVYEWLMIQWLIDWSAWQIYWTNAFAHTHMYICLLAEKNKLNKIRRSQQRNTCKWWMLLFYHSFLAPLLFLLTPVEFRAGCTFVDNTVFASVVTAEEVDSSCRFSRFTISKSRLVPTLNSWAHFLRWEWRDWKLNIDKSGLEKDLKL